MSQWAAIAVGGAAGALLRYGVSLGAAQWLGRGFPYGTWLANVSGCLLMGILYILLIERWGVAAEWRGALLVGLLGAFTTYSSFSIETLMLVESGEMSKALANVVTTVVACLSATWLGMLMARSL